jgi:8-amino-7-oxononanoate synthase
VQKLGLEKSVFARIHTFGKACGVHGAAILGSGLLKDYLVNFARPFIYTTALPPQSAAHILASYRLFPQMVAERAHLATLISRFSQLADGLETLPSTTPIQAVIIPGNSRVREVAAVLQQNRLDVRPVLYPTVPAGKERLRIVLHSFNTQEELDFLLNCLKNSV